MLFVPCCAVGRAHGTTIYLAAGTVVVAHLHGTVVTPVCFPVHHCGNHVGLVADILIAWWITKQGAVIKLWRAYDTAGIKQAPGVEGVFDFLEVFHHALTEHGGMKLGTGQAVTMFSGMGALVLANHLEAFFGDGTHLLSAFFILHVENGAHVQGTDRSMGIEGSFSAMLVKDIRQAACVFGQVLQLYRAVLNKGHGFTVALHGHHDIQALLAHFPDCRLERGVGGFHHAPGKTEIAH